MGVLEGLEPQSVFHFFEEISRIPHGSGNVKQISDYLKEFAEKRGLFCVQDSVGNIVIVREAAPEYENEAPYILQAHMDMVAVAAPGYQIDMKKEPLKLRIEDGKIYAEGTSLGGDDGIGMAYCLALLAADDISIPRLEVILTVDEETGMEGATVIDLSMLRGNRMINLDQEEEGVFTTSCAGGAKVEVNIPLAKEKAVPGMVQLTLGTGGLLGGHSGIEINEGRGNANWLLGSILCGLSLRYDVRLVHMKGGLADNAIPREAEAEILIQEADREEVLSYLEEEEKKIKESLKETDPGFVLKKLFHNGTVSESCYTKESTANALSCICKLPNGVIDMSQDVEGLVETSLNLGVLSLEEESLHLQYAVRSSIDQAKEELCRQMKQIAERLKAAVEVKNVYPGWAYRKDSPLREKMVRIYERMYGKKPVLEAIHAGLECGILAGKIEDLDCVSIGPDLENVHTAEEHMSIDSVGRVWTYLLDVLTSRDE
ncbi:MAG: beta-Ala-His dipeptidase [Lachnospiraceae bacterium]|nr:beta-Ala-His dipeptidase [Lachnospiraceae bacterium]